MRRAALVLLVLAACRAKTAAPPAPGVVLTTSDATAIAQQLANAFERQTSRKLALRVVDPQAIASGSGVAAIFREGDVRLASAARLRSVIGYADYFILGPANDPAHVRDARDAQEAYRRIAQHHRKFCSPVDIEGARGLAPPAVACHGDAAEVIATAARLGAYTILDRASANTRMPRHYEVLLRDVPPLHATYVAALLTGPVNHDAEWFVEWVMSYRGRDAVESLRIRSEH